MSTEETPKRVITQFRIDGEINGKQVTRSFEVTEDREKGTVIVRPLSYPIVTLEVAQRPNVRFHENNCTLSIGPKGGETRSFMRWRENGKVTTWKTRPTDFRLPIKYGMRTFGYATPANGNMLHDEDDCPLLMFAGLPKEEVLKLAGCYEPTPESSAAGVGIALGSFDGAREYTKAETLSDEYNALGKGLDIEEEVNEK